MSEFQVLQIVESAMAQIIVLIGHIITINLAMMVALFYFLNRASLPLKIASFVLYTLGSLMFLLLAIRESNVSAGAKATLESLKPETLSPLTRSMLTFSDSPISIALNMMVNASFWALWIGVIYLLFIWKRRADAVS